MRMRYFFAIAALLLCATGCTFLNSDVEQKPEKREWFFETFDANVQIKGRDVLVTEKEEVTFRGDFTEYTRELPKTTESGGELTDIAVSDENGKLDVTDYDIEEFADARVVSIPVDLDESPRKTQTWEIAYTYKNAVSCEDTRSVLSWSVVPFPRTGGVKALRVLVENSIPFDDFVALVNIGGEDDIQYVMPDEYSFISVAENIPYTDEYILELSWNTDDCI